MKHRRALLRLRARTARGHPLWWVLAGIVVGVAGTVAAFWHGADDDPLLAPGEQALPATRSAPGVSAP